MLSVFPENKDSISARKLWLADCVSYLNVGRYVFEVWWCQHVLDTILFCITEGKSPEVNILGNYFAAGI